MSARTHLIRLRGLWFFTKVPWPEVWGAKQSTGSGLSLLGQSLTPQLPGLLHAAGLTGHPKSVQQFLEHYWLIPVAWQFDVLPGWWWGRMGLMIYIWSLELWVSKMWSPGHTSIQGCSTNPWSLFFATALFRARRASVTQHPPPLVPSTLPNLLNRERGWSNLFKQERSWRLGSVVLCTQLSMYILGKWQCAVFRRSKLWSEAATPRASVHWRQSVKPERCCPVHVLGSVF